MTDRPIPFKGPMVRALLDGRKSQTRRVLTAFCDEPPAYVLGGVIEALGPDEKPYRWPRTHAVGDRLWVREAVRAVEDCDTFDYWIQYIADGHHQWLADCGDNSSQAYGNWWALNAYRSNDPDLSGGRKVPPIHMPRWASRLTLIVTAVKVERLQDISEADAIAEGAGLYVPGHGFITESELRCDPGYSNFLSPRAGFEAIWMAINGPGSWDANPFVAAYTFTVHQQNIDALASEPSHAS